MYTPGTVQLHHPSGKIFDAFCDFSVNHPDTTWHQTADFFHFALRFPEAEPVLLIAFHDRKLLDPGATYWTDKKVAGPVGRSKDVTTERIIAGSMLAVMIRQPLRSGTGLPFFRMFSRSFATSTIITGGPLLAKGTRLEKEFTLKVLLEGLHDIAGKRSAYTECAFFPDIGDLETVFRMQGFRPCQKSRLDFRLISEEEAWQKVGSAFREQVTACRKDGVKVIHNPDSQQIKGFYDVLKQEMAAAGKDLPQESFFHHLAAEKKQTDPSGRTNHSAMTEPGSTVFVTNMDDAIIGGIAMGVVPGKHMQVLFAAGKESLPSHGGLSPLSLACWSAMEYALKQSIPLSSWPEEVISGKAGRTGSELFLGGEWKISECQVKNNQGWYRMLWKKLFSAKES